MYTIMGATGNTGRVISERLLVAGKKVRVIGRTADRLASLVEKGAEAQVGAIDDVTFLTKAFTGASAVYVMIPPDGAVQDLRAHQNRVGAVIAKAIADAGVSHVVHLSSLGAELAEGTGPVLGLHDQEARLNGLGGVNVLHLRPTFFMENLLGSAPALKQFGVFGTALRADVRFPMIATRDIAEIAARRLLALDFAGQEVQELRGQRDVTMTEVTAAIGKAIGKPALSYTQFPYDAVKQAMVGMGMSQSVADAMIELQRSINEQKGIVAADRTPAKTTPTSIEEFAPIFASIYSGM